MKKIILIISILAVSFSSCSLLSDEGSKDITAIQNAENEAVQRIQKASVTEIESAKREISLAATDVISKADTTLTKKFQVVEQKAEAIEKDFGNRIQEIEDRITRSYIVGLVGTFIGIVGLIIAILAYKKNRTDQVKDLINKQVKDLINKEVFNNPKLTNKTQRIVNETSNSRQQTGSTYSSTTQQQVIQKTIKNYIDSREFKDQLEVILKAQTRKPDQPSVSTETSSVNPPRTVMQPAVKSSYDLYAKESNSMQLSSIQSSYQKGKSIYKLILADPNSNTAQVSLCIEQEDAKERILAYDNQYLDPICLVSRLSSQPTNVEVKSAGTAERIGEEWKVTKQVIVEIK